MMSPKEFASFLLHEIGERRVHEAELIALEAIGQMVEAEAKKVIGTYEFDWPQLAEPTQADRERKGYAPNEPLLRTGELRAAIEHQVDAHGRFVEIGVPEGVPHSGTGATVGDIATWQEFGTATIPPRPFLGPALYYLLGNGAIQQVVQETVGAAIASNMLDHELFEVALEAIHSIIRTIEIPFKMAERNDEEKRRDDQ